MEFKDRVRLLRNENGMNTTALAAVFGKSDTAIRMWETGRSKPDVDTLIKLAEYFECSTDYLLGLSEVPSEKHLSQIIREVNLLDSMKNSLLPETLLVFQDIEKCIIESCKYLAGMDVSHEDESIVMNQFCRILHRLRYHCESAYILKKQGCDSFDKDEVYAIIIAIDDEIDADSEMMWSEIQSILKLLKKRMMASLCNYPLKLPMSFTLNAEGFLRREKGWQ